MSFIGNNFEPVLSFRDTETVTALENEVQEWMTLKEAARYLRLSEQTLYRWRMEKLGPPSYKAGHHVRYRRTELDAWVTGGAE